MNQITSRLVSNGIAIVMAAMLALASLPGVAFAETRCSGLPGVQVWEDDDMSGATTTFCPDAGETWVNIWDLNEEHDGLFFTDSWNDRISSFETFNMVSGSAKRSCFYTNVGWEGSVMKKGPNGDQSSLSETFENRISSFMINRTLDDGGAGPCP